MRMITYIYMHTCYCTHVILLLNNLTVSMLSCITRLLEFSKYQKMFQHMPKLAHTDAHTHTSHDIKMRHVLYSKRSLQETKAMQRVRSR